MLKAKLQEFFYRALTTIWEMALMNPRMTGAGIAGALVIVGAHVGLDLTADRQAQLAALVALFIGLMGRDRNHHRRNL